MPNRAVDAAKRLLNEFGIRDVKDLDLEILAADRRVLVKEEPISGAEGRLVYRDGHGTITVNQNIPHIEKKRFVIGHEIGHVELHLDTSNIAICDENALHDYKKQSQESWANEFAAELLMPTFLFEAACAEEALCMDLIRHLAKTFRTSITATAIRYTRIGPTPAAVIYTRGGYVRWFWPSDRFPCKFVQTGVPPPDGSLAVTCMHSGQDPTAPRVLAPGTWFTSRVRRDQYFYEDCIVSARYDAVLSLCWECIL